MNNLIEQEPSSPQFLDDREEGHTVIREQPPRRQETWGSILWEFLQTIVITFIIFLAIRQVAVNYRIEGSSMYPTLHNGQLVFVDRISYRLHSPERGDIIIFDYPLDPKVRFVKRVIGLPGDTVSVHNGHVLINGKPLVEPYINGPMNRDMGPVKVRAGQLFVMGDNRNHSNDSRSWGPLDEKYIIGRAFLTYWPPSRAGIIHHWKYNSQ